MKLSPSKWYKVLAPRPAVLVSTVNAQGVSNAAPFSFVMPVSVDPPLIAFASVPTHDTAKNIQETGDFVVNIPGEELLKQLWVCRKDFPYGVSEIKEAGLIEEKSTKVKSPKIKECFAKFECKLQAKYDAGDHILFIGKVLEAEIRDDLFKDGNFQVAKANPLMHIGGERFGLVGEEINAV